MDCDFLVIGAGIAGVSVAWRLAAVGRTVLLETESQAGYHATGRSVAMLDRTYGNEAIRTLTAESCGFLETPPIPVSQPLLRPRGVLYVADEARLGRLQEMHHSIRALAPSASLCDGRFALGQVPILRPEAAVACLWDPEAADIDVAGLHGGWLQGFRQRGGLLKLGAGVTRLERTGSGWRVGAGGGQYNARVVINAAGAWADQVAERAGLSGLGLVPLRRTVAVVPTGPDVIAQHWPLVVDVGETWYFKGETGRVLVSPADETPVAPGDVQPDEIDVATGIERFESATTLLVSRVVQRWAGLRSFFSDRTPVIGVDPRALGFVWCAGQGGYGIQTAPAISALAAAAACGDPVPPAMSPARFLADSLTFDQRPVFKV